MKQYISRNTYISPLAEFIHTSTEDIMIISSGTLDFDNEITPDVSNYGVITW